MLRLLFRITITVLGYAAVAIFVLPKLANIYSAGMIVLVAAAGLVVFFGLLHCYCERNNCFAQTAHKREAQQQHS